MHGNETQTAGNIALLAPVPLEHLLDAQQVLETEEKVAFGSQRYDLFRQLDKERNGQPVDVYIYASRREGQPEGETFWRATYVEHVKSDLGVYPGDRRFRPKSTAGDTAFAVFWEVKALKPVAASEWCQPSGLTGFGKKKPYGQPFVPEGPILIQHP
jgi:hypothetical protein